MPGQKCLRTLPSPDRNLDVIISDVLYDQNIRAIAICGHELLILRWESSVSHLAQHLPEGGCMVLSRNTRE